MIKLTKIQFAISLLVILIFMYATGYVSYFFTRHAASLQVKEATPKQLAEAMQGDHFYADYPMTMLLVAGKVISVTKQFNDTVIVFQTITKPSALPKVTCDFAGEVSIKKGETIQILSVAYNAERQHVADVAMQNCYLVK